ncbi:MAG: hypothetical protein AAGK33_02900 [Pseudomonadota bacterium]
MRLADHIREGRKGVDARRVLTIVWFGALVFLLLTGLLLLLQRLGLTLNLTMIILGSATLLMLLVLAWLGRTMSSAHFFYANRMAGSTALGVGGLTDWISGSFLVLLLVLPLAGKMVLAPALMLGFVLQTGLFAMTFQRSGVATVSGFMDWRTRSRSTGLATLAVTLGILGLLIVADGLVLLRLVEQVTGLSGPAVTIATLALAGLPALLGGWLSLVLVNGVLAVWMVLSLLAPAIATGFMRNWLASQAAIAPNTQTIDPLQLADSALPLVGANWGVGSISGLSVGLTLFVLACGFATLPTALSRAALARQPIAAMETNSWTSLAAFLVLSAVPLSLALIAPQPEAAQLAQLLRTDGVLYALPHLALTLAALNALSVCLHTFAVALARALRRTRRLDPGEQSMFPARLVTLGLLVGLYFIAPLPLPARLSTPGDMLLAALALGAGGLFLPLLFFIWGPVMHRFAGGFAALAGGAAVATGFWFGRMPVLEAGLMGMGISGGIMLLAAFPALLSGKPREDLRHAQLRDPTPIS